MTDIALNCPYTTSCASLFSSHDTQTNTPANISPSRAILVFLSSSRLSAYGA